MAIELRTLKGTALTYEEVDRNFSQYFYSASVDDNNLNLWYTGSSGLDLPDENYSPRIGATISLSPFTGDVATVTPGGLQGNIQFKNGQKFSGTNDFHYDSIRKMVGINTAAPNAPLDIASTTPTPARLRLTAVDGAAVTDGKAAWIEFYRGAQTQLATVGLLQPGDSTFYINARDGVKLGVDSVMKVHLTDKGLGIADKGFTGTNGANQTLTVVGKIGVGNSVSPTDQSVIGQLTSDVRSTYLPSNSTTSGLLIESPKGSAGGHVVVGLNSTENNNESFTILRGAVGNYDRSIAVFRADGSVGINTVTPPADQRLTVNGNISGSGNLSIDGSSNLRGTATIAGSATVGSTLVVAGNTSLNAALTVAGTTTSTGAISALGALTVNGLSTLRSGLNLTGKLFGASIGADAYGGLLEIRERGFVTSGQTAWSFSPAITFHWGNRSVIRLGLRSDGQMAVDDNILLHANNFNSYAPTLTGGGASGLWNIDITGTTAFARQVVSTIPAGTEANLVSATIADNDYFRIRAGGHSNNGYVEIATADDGTEPIHFRQYNGTFTSIARTATILDGNGNTSLPGTLTTGGILTVGGSSATIGGHIVLHANNFNTYAPTRTGTGASGLWSIGITGNAATATTAGSAGHLQTAYVGGQQLNPQVYFNDGIGLKVAMTAAAGYWSDTLWINGYAGSDVRQMCAMHFQRNGQPRAYISVQPSNATSYGTLHEVLTAFNAQNAFEMNQGVRTTSAPTFAEVYNNGWFRNNNSNTGLYNQTTTQHLSSNANGFWDMSSTTSVSSIRFYTGGHVSALRGYVYANTSNEIGFLNSGGNWSLRVENSGNTIATGDLTAFSDKRVKENIVTVDNALEKVNALRGVYYNRTDFDDRSTKLGVIAQEVLEVVPEVVGQNTEGMYNVAYGNLAGLFIEAIKEQQQQIEELKQIVTKLTKK